MGHPLQSAQLLLSNFRDVNQSPWHRQIRPYLLMGFMERGREGERGGGGREKERTRGEGRERG